MAKGRRPPGRYHFLEQLVIHGHLALFLLQPGDLHIPSVLWAFLQHCPFSAEELFPPYLENRAAVMPSAGKASPGLHRAATTRCS
jgi:hypothetical protein